MSASQAIVVALYFGVLCVLSVYGAHRYALSRTYKRHRGPDPALPEQDELPMVTVQLPVFNERYVVNRLIDAVCQLDWPRDRLEIQVLDDSTDDTCGIAREAVEKWQKKGLDVHYLHRPDRVGFKAGALAWGLERARGDLVAVFDADFIPQAEFLLRSIPYFEDAGLGVVQARWGHLNRDHSVLTGAQAVLLDGHFVIEHTARNRSGTFFNFNGTAGVWRRQAIDDAGGWQHDTLTEDLDLSYRAQMEGWRFLYLPDLVVPAELPADMIAFKKQQHRWAKGSVQTALKVLPRLLDADLPMKVKREAFFHLTGNVAWPLMVVLSLLMPAAVFARQSHGWNEALLLDVPFFLLATISVASFYLLAERGAGVGFWERVRFLPVVLSLGIGMSINGARAVVEALTGHRSGFVRTPKSGMVGKGKVGGGGYQPRLGWQPLIELAIGVYLTVATVLAAQKGLWGSVPFLVLFLSGYLYVSLASIVPHIFARGGEADEDDGQPPVVSVELPAAEPRFEAAVNRSSWSR